MKHGETIFDASSFTKIKLVNASAVGEYAQHRRLDMLRL